MTHATPCLENIICRPQRLQTSKVHSHWCMLVSGTSHPTLRPHRDANGSLDGRNSKLFSHA